MPTLIVDTMKRVVVPVTAHDLTLTKLSGGRAAVPGEWAIEAGEVECRIMLV